MTATDELRHLLTERGVEWTAIAWNPKRETFYRAANGAGFCADEYTDGLMIHTDDPLTPEQAIAATLGRSLNNPSMSETLSERGTCRLPETRIDHGMIEYNGTTSWRLCSACGAEVLADPANYCPNCGAKVVDE